MDRGKQVNDYRTAGLSPAGGVSSASVSPEHTSTDGKHSNRASSRSQLRDANGLDTAPRQGSRTCSALREEAGGSFIPHEQLTFVRRCRRTTPCLARSLVMLTRYRSRVQRTFVSREEMTLTTQRGLLRRRTRRKRRPLPQHAVVAAPAKLFANGSGTPHLAAGGAEVVSCRSRWAAMMYGQFALQVQRSSSVRSA